MPIMDIQHGRKLRPVFLVTRVALAEQFWIKGRGKGRDPPFDQERGTCSMFKNKRYKPLS